jgi:hypothetical protein
MSRHHDCQPLIPGTHKCALEHVCHAWLFHAASDDDGHEEEEEEELRQYRQPLT